MSKTAEAFDHQPCSTAGHVNDDWFVWWTAVADRVTQDLHRSFIQTPWTWPPFGGQKASALSNYNEYFSYTKLFHSLHVYLSSQKISRSTRHLFLLDYMLCGHLWPQTTESISLFFYHRMLFLSHLVKRWTRLHSIFISFLVLYLVDWLKLEMLFAPSFSSWYVLCYAFQYILNM